MDGSAVEAVDVNARMRLRRMKVCKRCWQTSPRWRLLRQRQAEVKKEGGGDGALGNGKLGVMKIEKGGEYGALNSGIAVEGIRGF